MDALDHINIDVDDLSAAHEFYRDVLDLTLLRPPEDFQGDHVMFETDEGTVVTLVETGRGERWDEQGLDHPLDKAHVAFETDRATYQSVMNGLDDQFPKQGPYDWGEFEGFYFIDPSGNLLEVVTYDPAPADRSRRLLDHDDVE
jgi:catechol 2,3-dioxygenase-like lactoylglutathione lyase family enzyme